MQSALPRGFQIIWLCIAPVGIPFAARIAWEKTVWTWAHGAQSVGFSLMHIHPMFFFAGVLFSTLLMLWLVPGAFYLIKRWKSHSTADVAMVVLSALVALAIIIPDDFFVR